MRPVIGVTGNIMQAPEDKFKSFKINYSPWGYTEAVRLAGGTPVILPMTEPTCAAHYVSLIDGLVLTGGEDISPYLYNEEPHVNIEATSPTRDAVETALIKEALAQGKPILAICRGMQLVNVVLGGNLYQDLAGQANVTIQHVQKTRPSMATHSIKVKAGSYLSQLVADGCLINSIHHQAIRELGEGLIVSARSKDGVIEAIESQEGSLILGVQWHPERLTKHDECSMAIFQDLIERSLEAKQAR